MSGGDKRSSLIRGGREGLWGKNILKKLGFLTQFMLNYKIKLLSTHDELLQQAMGDKSLKSRAILNLMDKIWELKTVQGLAL